MEGLEARAPQLARTENQSIEPLMWAWSSMPSVSVSSTAFNYQRDASASA